MLSVLGISKSLPTGKCLLNKVSFTISRGEFVSILGSSGAGKSLTLRCIVGLTKPDSGEVKLSGPSGECFATTGVTPRELRDARRNIGLIFQGSNLIKRLSVLENVMIGRLGHINPLRSWLIGFRDAEARQAMEALDRVSMTAFAARLAGSLSGGELQRVAIARAIHQRPFAYLVDEPISSLDPRNAEAIMALLQPLARETPVLGAFHQPAVIARYCTRVIGMRQGSIVYDGNPRLPHGQLESIYGDHNPETYQSVHESGPTPPIFGSGLHAALQHGVSL